MNSLILATGVLSLMVLAIALSLFVLQRANRAGKERMLRLVREIRINRMDVDEIADWLYVRDRIQVDLPLPRMSRAATGPAVLSLLVRTIEAHDIEYVVEAGSGISSIVIGYLMKRRGRGRLISLEHDAQYHDVTSRTVEQHGLSSHVRVELAPLKKQLVAKQEVSWYDIEGIEFPDRLDLIYVDGPPRTTGTHARYAVLPVLYERLKKGGAVVLDDGRRSDERGTVERWREEYPDIRFKFIDRENGCFLGIRE